MTPDQLRPYQLRGIEHGLAHPNAMLWEGVGLGKTVQSLSIIAELLGRLLISGVLVIATLRIIQSVWRQEAAKWSHTRHLTFCLIHGTKAQREAALNRSADVYLCNYDNLVWLSTAIQHKWLRKGLYPPFSMVIYDEITRLKNPTSKRAKAWKPILPYFNRRLGLTGEPAANGYADLFGQFFVVDGGQRLGTSVTAFRDAFLQPYGYGGYDWIATKTGKEQIHRRVADITLELSAEDYLDLPPLINNVLWVDLPADARRTYDVMEKDFMAELDSGSTIEAPNAAALLTKLSQLASGATYLQPGGPWEEVHRAKLEALQDLVSESAGRPVLLGYTYRHEQERIAQTFAGDASFLSSKLSEAELHETLGKWERDELLLLCGHPACLHPWTEVLTEFRGWVKIIDVLADDRVFDGVEFVEHDGCRFSGFRETIPVFGVSMTPDHKLLVNGQWEEAQHVRDRGGLPGEALYEYQGDDQGLRQMFEVRDRLGDGQAERRQAQPVGSDLLSALYGSSVPLPDEHSDLAHLDGDENPVQRDKPRTRQEELQWSWNLSLRALGKLRELLRRYVWHLRRRAYNRAYRQRRAIQQRELLLGYSFRTASEQAEQSGVDLSREALASRGVVQADWVEPGKTYAVSRPIRNGRQSCERRESFDLQGRGQEKIAVYDLVNCGPRHRFVIRNASGQTFLSHNSMGHGVNLQGSSARALVWFSLPWSLELYNQMVGRMFGGLRRQGESVVHHILARGTVDELIYGVLQTKTMTQDGLKRAVTAYRERRGL